MTRSGSNLIGLKKSEAWFFKKRTLSRGELMANRRGGGGGVIISDEANGKMGLRLENPFTLKVGQVFTGFGIGCGIGIGVGRPLNLGAIPVLNQLMLATRGAADAFSGVQRPLNNALRKVGAKNIEAGIGCGVGFGHGFGVGLSVKPSALHQIQSNLAEVAQHFMMKLGIHSNSAFFVKELNIVKEAQPEASIGALNPQPIKPSSKSGSEAIIKNTADKIAIDTEEISASNSYSSRVEAILNNFLKDPIFDSPLTEQAGPLQFEKSLLQMVLKHQVVIDKLKEDNEKLQQILKVQPEKHLENNKLPCSQCFECRRRQRRR